MRILFYTFPEGHLVSDKEYEAMKKGFSKCGMELIRWHKDKAHQQATPEHDIVMVKGWSHQYKDIPPGKPLVYLSIGTEWKTNTDLRALNQPIEDLYLKSDLVIHISDYCKTSHLAIYSGQSVKWKVNEQVIVPAREPNLPASYPELGDRPLKLATTCIPRPVKRTDELEALCKANGIELVPAWGSVSDFSYYHECDGYIHLSRKEGMPNTVLEALAMGLPCIVTNYGGSKEAVGDAGIIIRNDPELGPWDPSNIEAVDPILFKEAIIEFTKRLPELRIKVRERVRSYLNDFAAAGQFHTLFNLLINENNILQQRSGQPSIYTADNQPFRS